MAIGVSQLRTIAAFEIFLSFQKDISQRAEKAIKTFLILCEIIASFCGENYFNLSNCMKEIKINDIPLPLATNKANFLCEINGKH